MTGQELATRTRDVVETIDNPVFLDQVAALLPDTVPLRRFVQVAKTAVRTNPDLVTADQTSLFGAIVRCAQDGLYPDGHQAALVPYKGKVSYLPMVDGVIGIAKDYGWTIRANVVYEHDDLFDVVDEPPQISHRRARPGEDRGQLIAAYAIATKDGERIQAVLYADDIAKRRGKAQTQAVWNEWPEAMWRKSAAHAIFRLLPKSELDRAERLARLAANPDAFEGALADPAAALYGQPNGTPPALAADAPAAPEEPVDPSRGPGTGWDGQQDEPAGDAAGSSPGGEEDADWEPVDEVEERPTDAEVDAAAATIVPRGNYQGKTLAEVATTGAEGETWLLVQLKRLAAESPARAAIETFARYRLPNVWDRYQAWKQEQGS